MKSVAIFRLFAIEGPGYLTKFLDSHSIPWKLIKIDSGESFPSDPEQFCGLVFMGGAMSVNDDLPWIGHALSLIKQAVELGIPVLGHCLGGQLMSKALGGQVVRGATKEIGWGKVSVTNNPIAREWLDNLSEFETFHWHGEVFSLPIGATRLLSNKYCENQAFALGIHLGMQCHVEMTEEMVKIWYEVGSKEIVNNTGPAVQISKVAQQDLANRIFALNAIASRLYTKWITGLAF